MSQNYLHGLFQPIRHYKQFVSPYFVRYSPENHNPLNIFRTSKYKP